MKKYQVYIVINVTCQEVYFGAMSEALEELFASVNPPELSHWEFEEALADLLDLEEKALANPQGKKILHNSLLDA